MTYHIYFSDLSKENQERIIETVKEELTKNLGVFTENVDMEKATLIQINKQFPITIII